MKKKVHNSKTYVLENTGLKPDRTNATRRKRKKRTIAKEK